MNIIAKRIKERREQLGLSAEQLAEKIGKAKTTIYRYESGFIEKMPSSVLSDIAEALKVSPTFLMGLEDENSNSTSLSFEEKHLVELIMQLNEDETKELLNFVDYIISKRK